MKMHLYFYWMGHRSNRSAGKVTGYSEDLIVQQVLCQFLGSAVEYLHPLALRLFAMLVAPPVKAKLWCGMADTSSNC